MVSWFSRLWRANIQSSSEPKRVAGSEWLRASLACRGLVLPNSLLPAGSGKRWEDHSSQAISLSLPVKRYRMQRVCSHHLNHLEDLLIPALNVLKKKNWVGTPWAWGNPLMPASWAAPGSVKKVSVEVGQTWAGILVLPFSSSADWTNYVNLLKSQFICKALNDNSYPAVLLWESIEVT